MFEPNTVYAKIAYDAILLYLKTGKKLFRQADQIPPALKLKLSCYVSLYSGNQLRACIGNPQPKCEHLYNEIIENAVAAAFDNDQTEPLKEAELNNISIVVDVISEPRPVKDRSLLKPGKHGVMLEDEQGKFSVLLPNQDGIDSVDQQLEKARAQAGIDQEKPVDQLKIYSFTTTSYQ